MKLPSAGVLFLIFVALWFGALAFYFAEFLR